jgi:2-C-methyl-D-erythritol 2,4-cyclodiphosphate synthase
MRVGTGYDIHRLEPGRKLLLGGVELPSTVGEAGWSDGDVLIHAVIDALMGPAGLGDIGSNFPPGRSEYAGIDSLVLLEKTREMLLASGFIVVNIDCVVVLQSPKILSHVDAIRSRLSSALALPVERISVKGKTKEGLDATGRGEAVEAYAVALLEEPER